ncbi:MAG: peptidoglycan-binding protein [Candidatus Nealsonbacteria bacterium]
MPREEEFLKPDDIRTMKKDIYYLEKSGSDEPKQPSGSAVPVDLLEKQELVKYEIEEEKLKKELEERKKQKELEVRGKLLESEEEKEKRLEREEKLRRERKQEETRQIEMKKRREQEKLVLEEQRKKANGIEETRQIEIKERQGEEGKNKQQQQQEEERAREERMKRLEQKKIEEEKEREREEERNKIKEEENKEREREIQKLKEQRRIEREEEERRFEQEEKDRIEREEREREEEIRKLKEDPQHKRRFLIQKKESIRNEKIEINKKIEILMNEKEPLEAPEKELLREIRDIEKACDVISQREKRTKEEKRIIEEKEVLADTPREKKKIEEERWGIEEKIRDLEKKRWPWDEKIKEVQNQIEEIKSQYVGIELKEKELRSKEKEILVREEKIELEIKKIDSQEKLEEIEELKNDLEIERNELFAELNETKKELEEVLLGEKGAEEDQKLIEEEERLTKDIEEKRKLEKERWEIEEKRRNIESKKWEIEEEKERIDLALKRIEKRFQNLLEKASDLIEQIKKIDLLFGIKEDKNIETIPDIIPAYSIKDKDFRDEKEISNEKFFAPASDLSVAKPELTKKGFGFADDETEPVQNSLSENIEVDRKIEKLEEKVIQEGSEIEQAKKRIEALKNQRQNEIDESVMINEKKPVQVSPIDGKEDIEKMGKETEKIEEGSIKNFYEEDIKVDEEEIKAPRQIENIISPDEIEEKPVQNIYKEDIEVDEKDKDKEEILEEPTHDSSMEKVEENEEENMERKKEVEEALAMVREKEKKSGKNLTEEDDDENSYGRKKEKSFSSTFPFAVSSEDLGAVHRKPSLGEKLWVRVLVFSLVLVLLAGVATFWYWYLIIRKSPVPSTAECSSNYDCSADQVCDSKGLCVAPPPEQVCENDSDCLVNQVCGLEKVCIAERKPIEIPPTLIIVEDTRDLEISDLTEIPNLISQTLQEWQDQNTFKRLVIKNKKENRVVSLEEFLGSLEVRVPKELYQKIGDNFTLFVYSQIEGNRIGFITEVVEKETLNDLMFSKETTLKDDFGPLVKFMEAGDPASISYFRNSSQIRGYIGPNFRYQTLAKNDLGILYYVSGEHFVFTTSWKTMEDTIERLSISIPVIELTKELKREDQGEEVKLLQTWLAQDSTVYSEAIISGWFGPLTEKAVIEFQEKHASDILVPQGIYNGTGIVDLYTRIKLNELYGKTGIKPHSVELITGMQYGDHSDEVRLLQTWLAKDTEVYPKGLTTGWFGPLTREAVKKFQEKYSNDILIPQGLTRPTGIVDTFTRQKLNELFGGQ